MIFNGVSIYEEVSRVFSAIRDPSIAMVRNDGNNDQKLSIIQSVL